MKTKPKIKIHHRHGFKQEMWECIGVNMFGAVSIGYGKTPAQAFEDWRLYYDFPF